MAWDFASAGAFNASENSAVDITGNTITISAWCWPDRVNSGDAVVTKWHNDNNSLKQYRLRVGSSGNVECSIRGSSAQYTVNSAGTMVTTKWQHMGMRMLGTGANQFSAWLDGTETQGTASQSIQNTSTKFWINSDGHGATSDTPINPLDGRIAEVALWNVGLSDGEMAALASGVCASMIQRASLAFYAPMNVDANPIDLSGNKLVMTARSLSGDVWIPEHAPVGRMYPLSH